MSTIRLQHGTSSLLLGNILDRGLQPRAHTATRRFGNWPHAPSNSLHVYLTNTYAFYYAQHAVDALGGEPLILEIEVDTQDLAPDEDWMEQTTRDKSASSGSIRLRTLQCVQAITEQDQFTNASMAAQSLAQLGTVAHRGCIKPRKILRAVRVPLGDMPHVVFNMGFDPVIACVNYRLLGTHYQSLSRTLLDKYPTVFKRATLT